MSVKSQYSRGINKHGRDFCNLSTSATIRGYLPSEGPAQFQLDAVVAPGDCLKAQAERKQYIVTNTAAANGYLAVSLLPYHLTCSISRTSADQNTFGRSTQEAKILANSVAIIISHNQQRATVPISINVQQGDSIQVSTGSLYQVMQVLKGDNPGVMFMAIAKHNNTTLGDNM